MTAHIMEQPISEADQALLDDIARLTDAIRGHQDSITRCAEERRGKILALRRDRITYREMAQAMKVTEQSVYKILRDHIPPSPRRRPKDDPSVVAHGGPEAAGVEEGLRHAVGQGGDGGDGREAVAGVAF